MHFYIVIEDCYNQIYSWPWISCIKRNEAIPAFLLLFFLIIEFSLSSYSSSTCANLSMYLLHCEGNAANSLPRNPTVQSSVPSLMRTTLDHLQWLAQYTLHNSQLEPDHIISLNRFPGAAFMLLTWAPIAGSIQSKQLPISAAVDCCWSCCWHD